MIYQLLVTNICHIDSREGLPIRHDLFSWPPLSDYLAGCLSVCRDQICVPGMPLQVSYLDIFVLQEFRLKYFPFSIFVLQEFSLKYFPFELKVVLNSWLKMTSARGRAPRNFVSSIFLLHFKYVSLHFKYFRWTLFFGIKRGASFELNVVPRKMEMLAQINTH